ncbi:MAG: MarR family transcriptional regulator [Clostridia bacterium]|nr:MarR family transcriptional regulator [Clostridia bacterium]
MKKFYQGGFLIDKIHQLSGRIFSKKLKKYNIEEINPAQGRILFVLWRNDGISIQELAQITSLGKSTLTSMLDRLEKAGYLTRTFCKDDRRKILIHAQNKDKVMKEGYEKVVQEMSGLYYAGFNADEIDQFEAYLKRIFNNLLQHGK